MEACGSLVILGERLHLLDECTALYGGAEIIQNDPSIVTLRDALYVPMNDARSPAGLYDSGRRIVLSGAYFRGPDLATPGNSVTPFLFSDAAIEMSKETFIYLGFLHDHFGHFLLSTFSRLWPYAHNILDRSIRIAVHTREPGAAEFFYSKPWAKELLSGVGLSERDFVTFNKPTRFNNVIVPVPSFEEGSYAHNVFAKLGNMVGANLSAVVPKGASGPAYLSKQKLNNGVRKIQNEDDLVEHLEKAGVDIIFPETLPMSAQAAMWRDRRVVASIVSSGLHCSILAPGRSVIAVSDSGAIQSSFALVDRVNNASATYLGVGLDQMTHDSSNPAFQIISRLIDPIEVAESILRRCDRAF